MIDLQQIGLNQYYMPLKSPVGSMSLIPASVFEVDQEIQQNKIRSSQANFKNFALNTNAASGTFALAPGSTIAVQSTIQFNTPQQLNNMMALPFSGFYEGAVADKNFQIWPKTGPNETSGTGFICQGGYDYSGWAGIPANVFSFQIRNATVGTTANIFYTITWRFLNYTTGSA